MPTWTTAIIAGGVGLTSGTLLEYAKGAFGRRGLRQDNERQDQCQTLVALQEEMAVLAAHAQDAVYLRMGGGSLESVQHTALYTSHIKVDMLRVRVADQEVRTRLDAWTTEAYNVAAVKPANPANLDGLIASMGHINERLGVVLRSVRAGRRSVD